MEKFANLNGQKHDLSKYPNLQKIYSTEESESVDDFDFMKSERFNQLIDLYEGSVSFGKRDVNPNLVQTKLECRVEGPESKLALLTDEEKKFALK